MNPGSSGGPEELRVGWDEDGRAARVARRSLAILVVVQALSFLDRYVLTVMVEPIKRDLGVSDTALGFLTGTAFAIFYTLAGVPLARWADHGVRRNVVAASLFLWSAMTAACGLARGFTELALARIGVGVGEAGSTPASHSMIADLYPPHRRATALAVFALGNPAGMLLGLVLGGWLTQVIGWRATFFVVGPPGILVALLVMAIVPEPKRARFDGEPGGERRPLGATHSLPPLSSSLSGASPTAASAPSAREAVRDLWIKRTYRNVLLATSACAFTGFGLATWMPAFLMRVHGMSAVESGLWLGFGSTLFSAAGAVLGARLADRLSVRDARWLMLVPAIGLLASMPFQLGFLLAPDRLVALACLVPGGFLGMAWGPASFSAVQSLARPATRALASAVVLLAMNLIGVGAGPQVVGLLNDALAPAFGSDAVRYSLAIVQVGYLVAVGLYLLAARTIREDLAAASCAR